jgi:CDP-diacylglycerol--serine O-phosphatidyltransferase
MKNIPNLFTLLNLVFGCLAIVAVLQDGILMTPDENGGELLFIPEKIWMASLFIGLAAVVDFIDGFVARLFKAESAMGKQLDSLADVVSFGVAPGIILYQFLRLSVAKEEDGLDASIIWLLPAFALPCAAAWRLARFNIDDTQSDSFKGLPVPSAGLFVAALPLVYWDPNQQWAEQFLLNKWFLYALIALLCWLMVSKLPLMALKFKDFSIQNNWPKYLIFIIAIAAFFVVKWLAIPIAILSYVIISLAFPKGSFGQNKKA